MRQKVVDCLQSSQNDAQFSFIQLKYHNPNSQTAGWEVALDHCTMTGRSSNIPLWLTSIPYSHLVPPILWLSQLHIPSFKGIYDDDSQNLSKEFRSSQIGGRYEYSSVQILRLLRDSSFGGSAAIESGHNLCIQAEKWIRDKTYGVLIQASTSSSEKACGEGILRHNLSPLSLNKARLRRHYRDTQMILIHGH